MKLLAIVGASIVPPVWLLAAGGQATSTGKIAVVNLAAVFDGYRARACD